MLLALICSCGPVERVGVSTSALIGGTAEPTVVTLSASQRRAIGRLMVGDAMGCTGWLTSARHLITAGHCFNRDVGPGQTDFVVGGTRWPLVAVTKHATLDVAVVTLGDLVDATPLELNTEPVDSSWVGEKLEVAGGGFGTLPSVGVAYWPFEVVSVEATRITILGSEAHGVCRGDSGGPYLKMFASGPRVVALESQGEASCDGQNWGPRVDAFAQWATALMAEPAPELTRCTAGEAARCEGDLASTCVDGWWRARDCAASERSCGFRNTAEGFTCLPKSCGAIDGRGSCRQGVASWCGPGGVESLACDAAGQGCGWSKTDEGFRCLPCTACDSQCVELQSDAQHCGACNTRCEGRCEAGLCAVEAPVARTDEPRGCSSTGLQVPWGALVIWLLTVFARPGQRAPQQ